jgi:hypothetical protein
MFLFVSFVNFVKSISVLVTALLGLKSSQKKLKACRDKKLKKQYVQSHKSIAAVYPILQSVIHKFKEVDRVSVFKSHNGNGVPRPGTPSFTTCLQEVTTHRAEPIIERWQQIPSDQEMIGIIGELIEENLCVVDIPEDPAGILSDYCVGSGIKGLLAVPIVTLGSGFLFLNLCSTTVEDLSEVDGALFEAKSCAARIAKLYTPPGT